jgi:hypothetical protein
MEEDAEISRCPQCGSKDFVTSVVPGRFERSILVKMVVGIIGVIMLVSGVVLSQGGIKVVVAGGVTLAVVGVIIFIMVFGLEWRDFRPTCKCY